MIAEAVHDCDSLNIATQEVYTLSQQNPLYYVSHVVSYSALASKLKIDILLRWFVIWRKMALCMPSYALV